MTQVHPALGARSLIPLIILVVLALLASQAATGATFAPTGSLAVARHYQIAIRLPSGKVLVAGGQNSSNVGLSSAEIFDPATGSWTTTGSMTFARFGHAAVSLSNGKVLVMGGTPNNPVCTGPPVGNSAEIFDPATGSWTLTANMNVARNSPAAVLLADGKVLVAGGGNRCGGVFASAEVFDPTTGTWTPTADMNVARQEPAGLTLSNGKVLVAGGSGGFPFPSLASAEIFDPTLGTWTLTGSMQNPRIWSSDDLTAPDGLIPLSNGTVFATGGLNRFCNVGVCPPAIFLAAAELFDPTTGVWTATGSMISTRLGHRTTLLATGQVLVTGGNTQLATLSTAEIFDPLAGTFGPAGNMATPRVVHTATLLADGRVLVAAGANAAGSLDSAEIWNSASDTTPPVITPNVTGTPGLNNWYVSNVNISWSVTDPESGIASSSGCDPVTLSANTAGTTVTCSATNGAGLSNSASVTVKIDQSAPNPPAGALTPAADIAGWNNTSATVSFMANGDVGPSGVASCTAPITVNSETAGTLESGVCADFAGNTSGATLVTVKIDETAPVASNVFANPDPVPINNGATLTAAIKDSGAVVSGVASAQYSIDGGTPSPMTGTFNQASVTASAALPAFTATGIYNVCVSGTDVAGNSSTAACIPLPVYDPTAGFVTGGGSINSPSGADLANPGASGTATFGFVSKYQKGGQTPSGNLEFHFKSGSLDFKSTSMDWLVVTGQPRAQFHGTGTIKDGSVCQFQVDAWDNSFQPGSLDAFGIKLYSCDNGQDRYSVAATPLASGSIIIHQ